MIYLLREAYGRTSGPRLLPREDEDGATAMATA